MPADEQEFKINFEEKDLLQSGKPFTNGSVDISNIEVVNNNVETSQVSIELVRHYLTGPKEPC